MILTKLICLRFVLLVTLRTSVAGNGLITTVQGQAGSVRDKFVGTWVLVAAKNRMKDGSERFYPELGPNGKGYLMYTADGHMCAQLMNPDRPNWKDFNNPTDAEKISAIDGFAAYCGRYEIDEARAIMMHLPELAWSPNFIGTKQPRPYTFRGDEVTFAGKVSDEPEVEGYQITWRKVGPRNDH
jgi:hypothetical protein